jgi:hypothetical protein
MSAPLVQRLPEGPLDIVGDVHGEKAALVALLRQLGYDHSGKGASRRHLVFVGDLVDRGPDSPGVVALVRRLVASRRATCLLGNHEFSLVRRQRKAGNGWFFGEVETIGGSIEGRYASRRIHSDQVRQTLIDFFGSLPVALERDDLRIVHAAWHDESIALARVASRETFLRRALDGPLRDDPRQQRYLALEARLRDYAAGPPEFDDELAALQLDKQEASPIAILLNGPERVIGSRKPFFVGGQWRYVERSPWWEGYEGPPVVVGHYWRRRELGRPTHEVPDVPPSEFWGRGAVYCVDYSIGRRFAERARGVVAGFDGHLAALRWPEGEVVFEDGARVALSMPRAG